jgi:hypothetical protein
MIKGHGTSLAFILYVKNLGKGSRLDFLLAGIQLLNVKLRKRGGPPWMIVSLEVRWASFLQG